MSGYAVRIRWLAFVTVLTVLVVLSACSDSPAPTSGPTATPHSHHDSGSHRYALTRSFSDTHSDPGSHRHAFTCSYSDTHSDSDAYRRADADPNGNLHSHHDTHSDSGSHRHALTCFYSDTNSDSDAYRHADADTHTRHGLYEATDIQR